MTADTDSLLVRLEKLMIEVRRLSVEIERQGQSPDMSALAVELRSDSVKRQRAALLKLSQ